NAARGLGWAAVNTGSFTSLARIAPPSRRGEASGYYSLFQALAATVGPPAALAWWAATGRVSDVFVGAALAALLAAALARRLRTGDVSLRGLSRQRDRTRQPIELVARSSRLPALLVVLIMTTQPAVLGFFPLYAHASGIGAGTVTAFYVAGGSSALVGRAVFGRVSDGVGRGRVLVAGLAAMTASQALLPFSTRTTVVLFVAVLYSGGQGMAVTALTSMAIERADKRRIGSAMATYSAAYQVGLGIGGLAAGALIGLAGYTLMYLTMVAFVLAALAVVVVHRHDLSPSV
ncbi:MAG TPA: MFS transporter, partial [Egicoccus sp.]